METQQTIKLHVFGVKGGYDAVILTPNNGRLSATTFGIFRSLVHLAETVTAYFRKRKYTQKLGVDLTAKELYDFTPYLFKDGARPHLDYVVNSPGLMYQAPRLAQRELSDTEIATFWLAINAAQSEVLADEFLVKAWKRTAGKLGDIFSARLADVPATTGNVYKDVSEQLKVTLADIVHFQAELVGVLVLASENLGPLTFHTIYPVTPLGVEKCALMFGRPQVRIFEGHFMSNYLVDAKELSCGLPRICFEDDSGRVNGYFASPDGQHHAPDLVMVPVKLSQREAEAFMDRFGERKFTAGSTDHMDMEHICGTSVTEWFGEVGAVYAAGGRLWKGVKLDHLLLPSKRWAYLVENTHDDPESATRTEMRACIGVSSSALVKVTPETCLSNVDNFTVYSSGLEQPSAEELVYIVECGYLYDADPRPVTRVLGFHEL